MNKRENEKENTRIEAFSDGVFAIAITLLVLDLVQLPHPDTGEGLIKSYLNNWEAFLAFLIGFCTVLVCWINHHNMFHHIKKSDGKFMWVNGFLLLVVTFTPFPTAILAKYIVKESHEALALFGFTYFMMSFVYDRVWTYAYNNGLLDEEGDKDYFYCIKMTYRYAILYTFISFFICFISIPVAVVLYIIMFAVFAFPKDFAKQLYKIRFSRHKNME